MSYMDCSRLQKPWTISTPVRGPSNLPKSTTLGCGAVEALRFRATTNFQKLNEKPYLPFSGEFSAGRGSVAAYRNSKFIVKAGSGQPLESNHESSSPRSSWKSVRHGIDVFYRFSRAYSLLGRFIGVLSMSLLAIEKLSDFSPMYIKGLLKASAAAVLMHLYVGGLNQLTDIEIDRVNKPYLPLASGEYSYKTGSLIVAFSAIVSFLHWMVRGFMAFILGPLRRLPRWHCIFCRFATAKMEEIWFPRCSVYRGFGSPSTCALLSAFSGHPDIEGDKTFGIQSYTSRLGQERVFWICVTLLEMAYAAAICEPNTSIQHISVSDL